MYVATILSCGPWFSHRHNVSYESTKSQSECCCGFPAAWTLSLDRSMTPFHFLDPSSHFFMAPLSDQAAVFSECALVHQAIIPCREAMRRLPNVQIYAFVVQIIFLLRSFQPLYSLFITPGGGPCPKPGGGPEPGLGLGPLLNC